MHNSRVRNWVIFLTVVLFVIIMKGKLVNAIFSVWVGTWVMSKLFKPLFGPHQGFEDLAWYMFVPLKSPMVITLLEMLDNKKLAFFILLWYFSGILATFLTYQLLKVSLISS